MKWNKMTSGTKGNKIEEQRQKRTGNVAQIKREISFQLHSKLLSQSVNAWNLRRNLGYQTDYSPPPQTCPLA